MQPEFSDYDTQRFWSSVDRRGPDDCWLWVRGRTSTGYGHFWAKGVHYKAHRVAYALQKGPVPDGHGVLHRCDTPLCQNGRHLFTGTHHDNVKDMLAKGRFRNASLPGEDSWNAKLTTVDVIAIRHLYADGDACQRELAERYGITQGTVSAILHRRTWRNV